MFHQPVPPNNITRSTLLVSLYMFGLAWLYLVMPSKERKLVHSKIYLHDLTGQQNSHEEWFRQAITRLSYS
uniref:Putative ovule protein n=1 Tax=Solanum chacoense TaxID=4108 RepID=A0A0V0H847_SOLCH